MKIGCSVALKSEYSNVSCSTPSLHRTQTKIVASKTSPRSYCTKREGVMKSLLLFPSACLAIFCLTFVARTQAQGVAPYSHAITDRLIHQETPMAPPPVNSPFADPDFGSMIVRATDETTNTRIPGSYLRNEASGQANMWSSDTSKFYVIG